MVSNRYEPARGLSRRKGQTNSYALSTHPSIYPAPTFLYLVLVFARPILSCPPQCVSPAPMQPRCTLLLPLRSSTEHVLSRVQNVLSRFAFLAPSRASSFFHLPPSLSSASLVSEVPHPRYFFPFTPHLRSLIPLSSYENARVNTCARAMGEKEHG